MAEFVISDLSLKSIADAIRAKSNTSSPLVCPDGFVSAIDAIPMIASGKFKGTVTGMAIDIPLLYSGNGYPIAVFVYPSEGTYNSSGTLYNLIQRYSIVYWAGIKNAIPLTPAYGGSDVSDQMSCFMIFKNSASNAHVYDTASRLQVSTYQNIDASASANYCVRIKSKNLMSVFIAASGYGFAANVEYSYTVIYS